ncbi:MAG TPA: DUF4097 family beta strand repeat-containing protein [Candidatus Binatia bacterium]|nr:DUF4097 family beta strand repeat-containing protein [Candidatus Binatia bacterium]
MRDTSPIANPTVEHRIGPRGTCRLHVASGDVRIRGVEGDQVRVKADDEAAFRKQFTVDSGDGFLDVRQNERLGLGILGRNESIDLEVELPHGATVKVESQSGDIDATDLSGDKSFRSASGEVVLARVAGAADLETVSGDVRVQGAAPMDLRVKSVSGDVEIRAPIVRRLDLGTTSGDAVLDAELRGEGPFSIRTISGDVGVVGRSGFRVEAETITGDVSSELAAKRESMPGRKVIVVGRPGPTLSFRSVSGDFAVVEPRQAAQPLQEEPMTEVDATTDATTDVREPSRPSADATHGAPATHATHAAPATHAADDAEARRLEILRELERGEISVAEAGERLGELDEVLR